MSRIFWLTLCLALSMGAMAEEDNLQQRFNQKYREFLSQTSQSLLPLPSLSKPDWQKIRQIRPLKIIYTDPDKFYNNKTYTFTLYQATDDSSYYLNAKGGFWGMDELTYGPLKIEDLQ